MCVGGSEKREVFLNCLVRRNIIEFYNNFFLNTGKIWNDFHREFALQVRIF